MPAPRPVPAPGAALLLPGAAIAALLDPDPAALERANAALLARAAEAPGGPKATILLDTRDPERAADDARRWAMAGAGAAAIPLVGRGLARLDSPRYEPLWRALEGAGLALVLHRGAARREPADPQPFDLQLHRIGEDDPLFDALFDALEVSYARAALLALIYGGALDAHPGLRVVVAGFGDAWVPYALARMDLQYEFRPERAAGEVDSTESGELGARHRLAEEGRGFSFPPGVRPSDRFRERVAVLGEAGAPAEPLVLAAPAEAPREVGFRLPFRVHSSDCHVVEPPDLWTARIDPRFRGREPRVARLPDSDLWVVDEGRRMAVVGIQAQAGRRFTDPAGISKKEFYQDLPLFTPERTLADMDEDGVGTSVMFGSNCHQAYRVVAGDLLTAIFRAFNDWILEFCAADPRRLRAVAVLNIDDPAEGVRELERVARAGAAGAMIPVLPLPGRRYDHPRYERLWAAAADSGAPLLFHVGANQAVLGREPVIDLVRHGMKDLHVRASIAALALAGVFRRHPRLRVGVVEFEASWVPHLMGELDALARAGRAPGLGGDLPSDHLRRGLFVNFQEDPACVQLRRRIGVDNLCWGSDYPHAEATFPRSHAILAAQLAGVPRDEAEKLCGRNAARLFGFDP